MNNYSTQIAPGTRCRDTRGRQSGRTVLGALAALAWLCVLIGCAVTRIDVDVYKGPLTDEKSVQVNRLAVMAIGARPLMIELRNELERLKCGLHKTPDQLAKASARAMKDGEYPFKSAEAERVNAVLSMYEDRIDPVIAALLAKAEAAIADYVRAVDILRPGEGSSIRERRRPLLIALAEGYQRPGISDLIKNKDTETDLRHFYFEMLDPRQSDCGEYLFYEGYILKLRKDWMFQNIDEKKTNEAFRRLENVAAAKTDAKSLFPRAGEQRWDEFGNEISAIARSFSESREALDRLLDVMLELTIAVSDPDVCKCVEPPTPLIDALAEYIASLTRTDHFDNLKNLLDDCRELKLTNEIVKMEIARQHKNGGEIAINRETLRDAIRLRPLSTARALLDLHRLIKAQALRQVARYRLSTNDAGSDAKYLDGMKLMHGLGRGPTIEAGEVQFQAVQSVGSSGGSDVPPGIWSAMRGFAPVLAQFNVFAGGRLSDGLITLIERYLMVAHESSGNPEYAKREREQLSDELVRFGQKIVFLANNEIVLNLDSSFGASRRDSIYTLQAIGNAIITQANELREHNKWEEQSKGRARIEEAAAYYNLPRSFPAAFERIIKDAVAHAAAAAQTVSRSQSALDELTKEETVQTATMQRLQAKYPNIVAATLLVQAATMRMDAAEKEKRAIDKDANAERTADAATQQAHRAAAVTLRNEAKAYREKADEFVALDAALKRLAAIPTERANLTNSKAGAETAHVQRTEAITVYKHYRTNSPFPGQEYVSYSDFFDRLDAAIQAQQVFNAPIPSQQAHQHAHAVLAEVRPIIPPPLDMPRTTNSSPTDVIDLEIASLEQRYRDLVQQDGKDSPAAAHVREAIDAAYAYRSGLVYIRPPSAFLKSSYPVTSLQSNDGGAWENMLGKHALRSVPFADAFAKNGDVRLRAEIDKQYWQTINSVRVAGAGMTNYVMVKDDIGNWYVKNFSGDPEPIIKAAKALAVSSAGAGRRATNAARVAGSTGNIDVNTPLKPEAAAFERLAGPFQDDYAARTQADAADVQKLAENFPEAVRSAWSKLEPPDTFRSLPNLSDIKDNTSVKAAISKATDALKSSTNPTQAGILLSDALALLAGVRTELLLAVAAIPAPSTDEVVAAEAALRTADDAQREANDRVRVERLREEEVMARRDTLIASGTDGSDLPARLAELRTSLDEARNRRTTAENALRTATDTRTQAQQSLAAARSALDKSQQARIQAKSAVEVSLGDKLRTITARRVRIADTYENALQVVLKTTRAE